MTYNYYMEQLNRLDINSEYPLSVKLYDGTGSTKQMNLNSESIPVLIEYLEHLEANLKAKEVDLRLGFPMKGEK